MTTIPSRDLRNHTADVLRQVAGGTTVTVTVNGRPVAEIGPTRSERAQFLTRSQLTDLLTHRRADLGLAEYLAVLAADTTDDLDQL